MTFNQLKYVVAVAKTGSINKAAAELFISQSVVSAAIAGLEKEIGHDIFVRSNRGVALRPSGILLYPMSRRSRRSFNSLTV